jgi:hypothetical protein
MRVRDWVRAAATLVVVVVGCGSRSDLLQGRYGEVVRPGDAGVDGGEGEDGALPDGAPVDERGPTPVPVCTGELSMCVRPDGGVFKTGAAVIQCQPEMYVGPWTLVLERLSGANWLMVQTQVVEEPGFGATFYDSSGPPTYLTYRVCALANSTTALCGAPFTTFGPPNCACEPTTCWLNTACNTEIDNQCGSFDVCGVCANGVTCNEYHTCCPPGFWSDGWGGCECAPKDVILEGGVDKGMCPVWKWDPATCQCDGGGQ